jgi:hypothetical protein
VHILAAVSDWVEAGLRATCHVSTVPPDGEWEPAGSLPHLLLVDAHRAVETSQTGALAPRLRRAVARCRDRNVPVAFWHTLDRRETDQIAGSMSHFDVVFCADPAALATSHGACAPGAICTVLPAAARRVPDRPPAVEDRPVSVAYFGREPGRRLARLLEEAAPFGLRMRTADDGRGPGTEWLDALREVRTVIAVDDRLGSSKLLSPMLFEALALGTQVVTAPRAGHLFGGVKDAVTTFSQPGELSAALERLVTEDDSRTTSGRRLVALQHTYAHRVATIATAFGHRVLPW